MKLVGKTFLGEITYKHKLENGDMLCICPDKEEIEVEGMGKIRKIYFSVLNENDEKLGIEGKVVIRKDSMIFLNIIFENDVDYAEFYESQNKEPMKKYLVNEGKLYLKDGNEFFEVEKSDSGKVSIDSEMTFLGKNEEYRYKNSTNRIDEYRKLILDAFKIFFEQWKSSN